VPLYLQHLFFHISSWDDRVRGYTPNPDNYNRLISAALDLDEAVFVTLNYDTLLDRRLFAYGPLTAMESYFEAGKNWSLIKLHGSVDWGYLVSSDWERRDSDPYLAETFARIGDDLTLHEEVMLRLQPSVAGTRNEGGGGPSDGRLYYPALSAPLGPGDEIVCPPDHVEFLRGRLRAFDGLNVLVIGYSGLDQEVLKLLSESKNWLRSLAVVSHTEETAVKTSRAITGVLRLPTSSPGPQLFVEGFDAFAQGEGLRRVIDDLG
jgi:hypothetical protein